MPERDHERIAQFSREYEELFAYISRYVAFRVPHTPSAEDIVSETFLYGYAHLDAYNPERGSLRQWLTGIAKNKIADHWKALRPTVELLEAMDVLDAVDHLSTDASLDAAVTAERILATLTPEARALFTLRFVDGMTYEAIAKTVRKKPSTIRTYFSRALANIRQHHTL